MTTETNLSPEAQLLLDRYDDQMRRHVAPQAPGWTVADLGKIIRATGATDSHTGGFVEWSDLGGLTDAEVDAEIAAQVAYFATLDRPSEWKHYSHDEPADLSDRLVAAGLVREDPEALILGETARVVRASAAGPVPSGVHLRRLTDVGELSRVADLHAVVWPGVRTSVTSWLAAEITAKPDDTVVFLAEDEETRALMSAAWIRFTPGTDFAGLWGGSTHPDWRRRGAYRALVRVRAELAAARGVPYLQVDASPESEPILTRLGLDRVATTTPHTWDPTAHSTSVPPG